MGRQYHSHQRGGRYTGFRGGLGLDFTPVVKYLILANVVVFLLQIFAVRTVPRGTAEAFERDVERWTMSRPPGTRVSVVQEWFELDPEKTLSQGQVWRLLTCAFCHHRQEIWHILFNMVFL